MPLYTVTVHQDAGQTLLAKSDTLEGLIDTLHGLEPASAAGRLAAHLDEYTAGLNAARTQLLIAGAGLLRMEESVPILTEHVLRFEFKRGGEDPPPADGDDDDGGDDDPDATPLAPGDEPQIR